jgi:hypothetical protein
MRDEEIEIGDKLRIREWYDMKNEFGEDGLGRIRTRARFLPKMRELCGSPFTVADKRDYHTDLLVYASSEDCETINHTTFLITSDMLERVTNSDELDSPEDFDAKFSALFA